MSNTQAIAGAFSKHFLGNSGVTDYEKLLEQYRAARNKLLELRKSIVQYQGMKDATFGDQHISSITSAIPTLSLECTNGGDPVIYVRRTAVSFHFPRGASDADGNWAYTTHPAYSFRCVCKSRQSFTLRNVTFDDPDSFLAQCRPFDDVTVSKNATPLHPHATERVRGEERGSFESVCVGSNPYRDIYGRTKSPYDVLRMMSLMHEWFSSANLGDMYGNLLAWPISLGQRFFSDQARQLADELFALAQQGARSAYAAAEHGQGWLDYFDSYSRIYQANPLMESVTPTFLNQRGVTVSPSRVRRCAVSSFIFAYALWCLNHPAVRINRFSKNCLFNAMCWDVLMPLYMDDRHVPPQEVQRIAERVFQGPARLKRYLLDSCVDEREINSIID